MPIGFFISIAFIALCTLFAVAPPPRSRILGLASWLGMLVNELPFIALYWLVASTVLAFAQGVVANPIGYVALGLGVLTLLGLVMVVRRGAQARPVTERALRDGLHVEPPSRRAPLARVLFAPFAVRRRDVERLANIRYGADRRNMLDVYRHRSRPTGAPVLVYLHGGGYFSGRKNREARLLLYRMASRGWVCVSANYRLLPGARWPDPLVDAKRVIAWVREHGRDYGADPAVLVMSGSSAGGHMASIAGLTPNDPASQPGFESADTSVTAVVGLYGYYGSYYSDMRAPGAPPSTPIGYARPDAPPFFMAHGDRDTVVGVSGARELAARLREVSASPVVYVELPGAQHAFDLFVSLRFAAVVDGAETFLDGIRGGAPSGKGIREAQA